MTTDRMALPNSLNADPVQKMLAFVAERTTEAEVQVMAGAERQLAILRGGNFSATAIGSAPGRREPAISSWRSALTQGYLFPSFLERPLRRFRMVPGSPKLVIDPGDAAVS